MWNRCSMTGLFLAMVLSLAGGSHVAQAADTAFPALQYADAGELAETLHQLGMDLLLEELAQMSDDPTVQAVLLRSRLASATGEEKKVLHAKLSSALAANRERLWKQAEATKDTDEDAYDDAILSFFDQSLQLAEMNVLSVGRPYYNKMIFLLDSAEDAKAMREAITTSAEQFFADEKKLRSILRRSRMMSAKLIYLVPELSKRKIRYGYKGAFARYYLAMALKDVEGDEAQKTRLAYLKDAVTQLQAYVDTPAYGVQPFAWLMQGRCKRELGDFESAAAFLERAAGGDSIEAVLIEALFEGIRNQYEWGVALMKKGKREQADQKFKAARKALDGFVEQALAVVGEKGRLGLDVKKLILEYAILEQWANALRLQVAKVPAEKKAELEALVNEKNVAAQKAFMAFMTAHPDPGVQEAVLDLFGQKFSGADVDYTKMGPVIVLILAKREVAQASQLRKKAALDELDPATRKVIEDKWKKAGEMYEFIRVSKDPSAAALIPGALWGLGILRLEQGDNLEAMKMFRELVAKFPQDEQAEQAALLAVRIGNEVIRIKIEEGEGGLHTIRTGLVESLRLLLKQWGDKSEYQPYYFDLGWQCYQLSDVLADATKRAAMRKEALAAFQNVPPTSPLYNEAQYIALSARYADIMEAEDLKAKAVLKAARTLEKQLNQFGSQIYPQWKKATKPSEKKEMGEGGSTSEYRALVLGHDILGLADDSLRRLAKLPARWPDTPILRTSQEFLIRQRLAKGDVVTALEDFESFKKKYGEAEAQGLMQAIVDALRSKIQELLARDNSAKKAQQLATFRKDYLAFAKKIYETQINKVDEDKKYEILLLYAEALSQSGVAANADLAIKDLFPSLDRIAKIRRDAEAKAIRGAIAPEIKLVESSRDRWEDVDKLNSRFVELLSKLGMEKWDSSSHADLRDAIVLAKRARDIEPPDRKALEARIAEVRGAFVRAYQVLQTSLEKSLHVDSTALLILARCHATRKDYREAGKLYRRLLAGMLPEVFGELYWTAQIEKVENDFQSSKDDPREMKMLIILIDNQIRKEYPRLGGPKFLPRFNKVVAEARQRLKK